MKLAFIFGVMSVVAAMAMGIPAETEETRPAFPKPDIMVTGICATSPELPCCNETIEVYNELNGPYEIADLSYPDCRADGFYAARQCHWVGCYCVNKYGIPDGSPIQPWGDDAIECPEMQAVSADELKSREEHRAADPAKDMEKAPKALAALLKLNRLKSRRANDPGAESTGNKTEQAKRSAYCGLIGEEANLWHCISWLLPINRVKSNRAKAPGAESAALLKLNRLKSNRAKAPGAESASNKRGQAKRAAYCGLKGEGANLWHCIDWIPLFKIWG